MEALAAYQEGGYEEFAADIIETPASSFQRKLESILMLMCAPWPVKQSQNGFQLSLE